MRLSNHTLLFILLTSSVSVSNVIAAKRPREVGTPFIYNYTASDYGEESQVLSIVQDRRGVMYFGLERSIAEFDGKHWKLIPLPLPTARGLAIDEGGTIYVGVEGDFGYLAGDSSGELRFVSLKNKLSAAEQQSVTTIWSVCVIDQGIYFLSQAKAYVYHEGKVDIIEDKTILGGSAVSNSIYTSNSGLGAEEHFAVIHENTMRHVPFFEQIDGFGSFRALPWSPGKALIIDSNKGMFIHDLERFNASTQSSTDKGESFVTPFPTEVDAYLAEHGIYCAAKISENEFALGTWGGGIVIIDSQGKLIRVVNRNRGLIDDAIWSLFVDRSGNLWAATNAGISYVIVSSPLSVFDKHHGINSSLNYVAYHKETLYLGTFDGVFFLPPDELTIKDDDYQVSPIEGISTYSVAACEHDEEILAADGRMLKVIVGHKSRALAKLNHTVQSFAFLRQFPDHLFVGLQKGIAITRLDWQDSAEGRELTATVVSNKILDDLQTGFPSIAGDENGDLWAASWNKGIYQIKWHGANIDEFSLYNYGTEDGLPSLANNSLFFVNGRLVVGTEKGIWVPSANSPDKKDQKPYKFVQETTFGRTFNKTAIMTIRADKQKNIWVNTSSHAGVLRLSADGTYRLDTTPTDLLPVHLIDIYPEEKGIIWFVGGQTLYKYDPSKPKNYRQDYYALIRKVTTGNKRQLLNGEYFDPSSEKEKRFTRISLAKPPKSALKLPYSDNGLTFEFSAAFFERPEKTEFQFKLEGFDKNWSDWTNATTKEYTNLSEGSYVFRVKAKNVYGLKSKVASYQFSILSPWYRTVVAYIAYVMLGIGLLIAAVRLYNRRLIAAKKKLEEIVKQRTIEVVRQKDEITRQRDEISLQREALWGEMELAKKIQTVLLPEAPEIEGYEIAAYMNPADEVGGDYYDVFNVDGSDWIVIGDVSGHGVPAGLIMMMVQTSIHSVLDYCSNDSPLEILRSVNKTIYDNIQKLGESKYMTITLLSVQEGGTLSFSGLHQDILIYRAAKSDVELVETDGMWIGVVDEIGEMLDVRQITLNPGDAMLLYTDGITEAKNADRKMFSDTKLVELFRKAGGRSTREIEQNILDAIQGYELDDDITFMIVKRKPGPQ